MKLSWVRRSETRVRGRAKADRPIVEGPRKQGLFTLYNLHKFRSAEAESTYWSSAEAKTVVAEAARRPRGRHVRVEENLFKGFRHCSI